MKDSMHLTPHTYLFKSTNIFRTWWSVKHLVKCLGGSCDSLEKPWEINMCFQILKWVMGKEQKRWVMVCLCVTRQLWNCCFYFKPVILIRLLKVNKKKNILQSDMQYLLSVKMKQFLWYFISLLHKNERPGSFLINLAVLLSKTPK